MMSSSLHDYILWLGDYAFDAVPFQDVDALILCLLSYLEFKPLFERSEEVFLRDCQWLIDTDNVRIQFIGEREPFVQILQAAAQSRRFGALRVTDYEDIMLPEGPIQFSALTFHSGAGWSFIAYRGTDSSLAGWKEDFMISFKRTAAQALAAQYAQEHIDPGHAWYIGGHSKGGNHALYAACMLSDEKRAAVRRMFLLDGPGFCPEVIDPDIVQKINPLTTRVIPGFSVIGKLFEPRIDDTRIVESSASGLLQHDLSTWGVDHGKLALLQKTDPGSDLINTILDKWIVSMPCQDREVFVNDIFNALGSGGAKTLEELESQDHSGYETLNALYNHSSEITRRMFKALSRQAIHSLGEALFHRNSN